MGPNQSEQKKEIISVMQKSILCENGYLNQIIYIENFDVRHSFKCWDIS